MKDPIVRILPLTVVALLLGTAACTNRTDRQASTARDDAVAVIHPTAGHDVEGTVEFKKVPDGVRVTADLSGLAPGRHGFHVHEAGDCSAGDASSAGEHFDPLGGRHGDSAETEAHVGDMGNVEADSSGHAKMTYVDPQMTLEGETSVVGRAVIVHAESDDLETQPSGDSGARVGCGVIEPPA